MFSIASVFRRCLRQNREHDGMFIRDAPLMNRSYDTGNGITVDVDLFFGIRASQALHGYREPTVGMVGGDNDWWNAQYDEEVDIDVRRGGMRINHNYRTSMFTEGTKYIDIRDGKLLDNYK